jgi:F0F1-type ATP synthase membrane subunit b/b'
MLHLQGILSAARDAAAKAAEAAKEKAQRRGRGEQERAVKEVEGRMERALADMKDKVAAPPAALQHFVEHHASTIRNCSRCKTTNEWSTYCHP